MGILKSASIRVIRSRANGCIGSCLWDSTVCLRNSFESVINIRDMFRTDIPLGVLHCLTPDIVLKGDCSEENSCTCLNRNISVVSCQTEDTFDI